VTHQLGCTVGQDARTMKGVSFGITPPPQVVSCPSPAPKWNAVAGVVAALLTSLGMVLLRWLWTQDNVVWMEDVLLWVAVLSTAAITGSLTSSAVGAALPDVGDEALLSAEAAILADTAASWRHEWTSFADAKGTEWHVHSVCTWRRAGGSVLRSSSERDAEDQRPSKGDLHVVLLHGHSSGAALFQALFDPVLDGLVAGGAVAEGARVWFHALDMPGWGRSPAPAPLMDARRQSDVVEQNVLMTRGWFVSHGLQETDSVVLMGHSVGGIVACHYTNSYPSDVRQLVLADPAGTVPAAAASLGWTLIMRFFPPQLFSRIFGRFGRMLFEPVYDRITDEDKRFAPYYYTLAYCTSTRGKADVCWGGAVRHDMFLQRVWWVEPSLQSLLSVSCPMSLIWGSKDEFFPADHAALVHVLRPDSDVYVIDGASHNPAHSDPMAVAAAIVDAVLSFAHGDGHTKMVDHLPPGTRPITMTSPTGHQLRVGLLRDRLPSVEWPVPKPSVSSDTPVVSELRARAHPSFVTMAKVAATLKHRAKDIRHRRQEAERWSAAVKEAGGGKCRSCGEQVSLDSEVWRCGCGSWTFVTHAESSQHYEEQQALTHFLFDLHVKGRFAAKEAPYLTARWVERRNGATPEVGSFASPVSVAPLEGTGHVLLISSVGMEGRKSGIDLFSR
jgi:pimeloyl-ACP methyl ester carboxylesterase